MDCTPPPAATCTTSYYLTDRLGSTRVVLDDDLDDPGDDVLYEADYEPFGTPYDVGGTDPAREGFRFAGERHDAATGLIHLRARQYDPDLGRFVSPDPIPGALEDPQSLNPFPYVVNNPLRYVDPLGLTAWDADPDYKGERLGGGRLTLPAPRVRAGQGGKGPVLKGQQGERIAMNQAAARGDKIISKQVTFEHVESGTRMRLDAVVKGPRSYRPAEGLEAKFGPHARFTPNQESLLQPVKYVSGRPVLAVMSNVRPVGGNVRYPLEVGVTYQLLFVRIVWVE